MADHMGAPNGEHSSTEGSDGMAPPNHLGTDVPSGNFTDPEKHGHHEPEAFDASTTKKKAVDDDEEEDEDMDALIDDLESQDGHVDEEEEETAVGGERRIPEELLQTSTRTGLTETEVGQRRKKYGLNQMKEEKENLFLKFLGYFVGPIQFVMEVRIHSNAPIANFMCGVPFVALSPHAVELCAKTMYADSDCFL